MQTAGLRSYKEEAMYIHKESTSDNQIHNRKDRGAASMLDSVD
jgi:hypothetical protein